MITELRKAGQNVKRIDRSMMAFGLNGMKIATGAMECLKCHNGLMTTRVFEESSPWCTSSTGNISRPMESKGPYGAPPNYADSVQPPSYQGIPGNPPYPAAPPMGGPGMPAPQLANPPVVVQTVYVQPNQPFSFQPMQITCPSCNQVVITRISHSPGALTWLSCGGLFLVGCVFGCCLIPFCVDGLQDVEHNCPNCGRHLGSCKRL
ncbi:lipopolysaccharide-induced tumor necrosis factor-alpha factor homolog isoform X2 [Heterodontus francisci]|uniref:lipopolysaccharide-induced tumor necrosis factor-alpha factor homolog isoform X2 n=1 Tax=Heterodontus francisci TaxID=7792 RepID=UPI00355BCD7C